MDPKELFLEPLKATGEKIIGLLPALIGALVILLLGWLLSKILKAALIKLLVAVRLEKFSARSGLSKFLSRGDIKHSLADILGTVFFWIIFLFFIDLAADVLKFTLLQNLINTIISFIPRLVVAVLIIVVGVLLSSFFKGVVRVAASSYALARGELIGTIVQYMIVFFALAVALEQLGVATQILVSSVLIIVGALAFGFALAFGLGSKEVAGKIVGKILESEKTAGEGPRVVTDTSEKEEPIQKDG
ncbi:MAG: hypothetical protein WBC88_03610 [Candidatus Zixiibacteriota bacterium]